MSGLLILLAAAALLLIVILTAMLAHEMVHPSRRTAAYAVAHNLGIDPGDLGLEFDEWMLDRPDGGRLAVWEIKAQAASTARTAIVVHDWGESRINALARSGLLLPMVSRLVLYDLRGHGESSGTSRLGHGEDDDLVALCERLGATNLLLVGRGMGAVIAMHAASKLMSPPLVGLIAEAPYMDYGRMARDRIRGAGSPARPILGLALLVHRIRGVRPLVTGDSLMASLSVPTLVRERLSDAEVGQFLQQHLAP